jgi:hypothetical protein
MPDFWVLSTTGSIGIPPASETNHLLQTGLIRWLQGKTAVFQIAYRQPRALQVASCLLAYGAYTRFSSSAFSGAFYH